MAENLDSRMRELDERERYNLKRLRDRLKSASVTPEAVGEALPEAVVISAGEGQRLHKSMVETTERAIELSINQDPSVLATALFPIIGSAIRKAIERLVNETLVNVNAGLEKTLSFKRLGWRFESLRSGVPFYEIVLRNTLKYRVEHAFLIHKRTGLLLSSVSRPDTKMADKDMVASMLTAIQDYVRDSLALDRGEAVESLSAGEFSILVEEGPQALLALVVRGTADPSIRGLMQDVVESAHLRFSAQLKAFSGDVDPFEAAEPLLLSCLVSQDRGAGSKPPVYAFVLLGLIAAAAVLFLARDAIVARDSRALLRALESEPGYVVVEARRSGASFKVRLLRDPLARRVEELSAAHPLRFGRLSVEVEGYASLEPRFVLERLTRLLSPPPSVRLGYVEGELVVEGAAPATWRSERLPLAYAFPGVDSIRFGSVALPSAKAASLPAAVDRAMPEDLLALAKRLGNLAILFDRDSGRLLAGQEARVDEARSLIQSIVARSREAGLEPSIEVIGHTAGALRDANSVRVSSERAGSIFALLSGAVPSLSPYLSPRGAGDEEPIDEESTEAGVARNRSVTFKATFR